MENYCAYISEELTRKLYDVGMPLPLQAYNGEISGIHIPYYAQVFDWLMEQGLCVSIGREYDFAEERVTERFEWSIDKEGYFSGQPKNGNGYCDTWQDAANSAINRAIELIKEK